MLYLVATPIGNLGDITLRAVETLKLVDMIASEDTRKTGRLLKHLGIEKPQIAFYEHNEERAGQRVMSLLREGRDVALVTSAGTPGIADPGFTLVRQALREDIPVTMAPGPTGLIMAVVLSGLPVHSFVFRGFVPRKSGARRRFLDADRLLPYTLIYYESPHRLLATLADAIEILGDRPAAIANDLTKLYETIHRGRLSELVERLQNMRLQGEFILVIAGAGVEVDEVFFAGGSEEEDDDE
jgi:16S rRNA (cytidine1402-2'-O)-methyltransferase